MEKFHLKYRHESGAKFTICIKARLTADLTILPLRDCEVCVLIVREGSVEEYTCSLNGYAIIDFVVRAKRLRATGLNFRLWFHVVHHVRKPSYICPPSPPTHPFSIIYLFYTVVFSKLYAFSLPFPNLPPLPTESMCLPSHAQPSHPPFSNLDMSMAVLSNMYIFALPFPTLPPLPYPA